MVTYDPLNGGTILDTNFTVASVFSIWNSGNNTLTGRKISEQINAVVVIYGPRTTALYYNATENKVQELTSVEDYWIISHDNLKIKSKTNLFAPGNLRACG